jgi:hypothetical protein
MDRNVVKHFGVLGMKWGRRKSPEQQAHSDKVKSLKSQIQAKKIERWNKEAKQIEKQQNEMYSRIERIKNEKISKHASQSKGKFDAWLGRTILTMDANVQRDNVVSVIEDRVIKADDKRYRTLKSQQKSIRKKYSDLADKLYETQVKGLRFPADLKASLKLDRELRMKEQEELLEAELALEDS